MTNILDASWPYECQETAMTEGWDLFDSQGSVDGPWQIQRIDFPEGWPPGCTPDPCPFEGDADAWVHVRTKAAEGSPLHIRVLWFLLVHHPAEYFRVMSWGRGGPHDRSQEVAA